MAGWQLTDGSDQRGRVAVVTGANTGIGFETAVGLARRGATVLLACRSLDRAKAATDRITARVPGAPLEIVRLDLASLSSVRAAAEEITGRHDRIDLLVNNAGVNGRPGRTEDGFDMHFGVNHLGHFALTGLLLERLRAVPGSRVVTVCSLVEYLGRLDQGQPATDRGAAARAYAHAKLANLMFSYELARRLAGDGAAAGTTGSATRSVAAHPGGASSEMVRDLPGWLATSVNLVVGRGLGLTAEHGALPSLRAALDPSARNGDYYGPTGLFQAFGPPGRVGCSAHSRDVEAQQRLWAESERLTGVRYPS